VKLTTLKARLLLPALSLSAIAMVVAAAAGSALVVQHLSARFEEQASRTVEFVATVGSPYVTNYDLTALGTFVKELARDEQVAFAEFFDAEGKSLTGDVAKAPADTAGLLLVEREIKDPAGKVLGRLKAGFRGHAVAHARDVVLGAIGGGMLAVLAVVALLLLWSVRYVMRVIGAEPKDAVALADGIARGDLTLSVPVAAGDATSLMSALARMQDRLRQIVGNIRQSAGSIGVASTEVATGNQDLSQRTEQQASALEETSASLQQMTATVKQNAENAKQANQLAGQASGVAARGGEVVREAVSTMNGITAASKKIADIIGVIDGIAFQTNILALNAAVEAARAGEQGRGFAVVASEVRSLAQRSAAAAKEIKDLITDSVGKVDTGSRQVNDAGRTMEEIVASVKKVTGLIAEITAASQEQAQGIEQVSSTMSQLEKVTQQNAAMVEQASAAAGSLEEQSRALTGAVAVFRMNSEPAQAAAKPAPAARAAAAAPKAAPLASAGDPKPSKAQQEDGWQEF
jgi:methyl-accepting chemotaxis protein